MEAFRGSEIASSSLLLFALSSATAFLISLSLNVRILYVSKPSTFLSRIPSAILYSCNSFPKTVAVVFIFFSFSFFIGVPVNPKKIAFVNVRFMAINISPKVDLCASSTIKTSRFLLISSISLLLNPSSLILLIF